MLWCLPLNADVGTLWLRQQNVQPASAKTPLQTAEGSSKNAQRERQREAKLSLWQDSLLFAAMLIWFFVAAMEFWLVQAKPPNTSEQSCKAPVYVFLLIPMRVYDAAIAKRSWLALWFQMRLMPIWLCATDVMWRCTRVAYVVIRKMVCKDCATQLPTHTAFVDAQRVSDIVAAAARPLHGRSAHVFVACSCTTLLYSIASAELTAWQNKTGVGRWQHRELVGLAMGAGMLLHSLTARCGAPRHLDRFLTAMHCAVASCRPSTAGDPLQLSLTFGEQQAARQMAEVGEDAFVLFLAFRNPRLKYVVRNDVHGGASAPCAWHLHIPVHDSSNGAHVRASHAVRVLRRASNLCMHSLLWEPIVRELNGCRKKGDLI